MTENESRKRDIDWRLTSFEGARREQLRRWAQLPLERIIAAQEEMAELSEHFARMRAEERFQDLSKIPADAATETQHDGAEDSEHPS